MKKKVIGIFVFMMLICTIFSVSGQIDDFSDNDEIAHAVDQVADEYRDAKKYEKALELYKYVCSVENLMRHA